MNIGFSKKDKRVLHWKEIQSRVTTHEGEFLSGRKGREYQQKWGKKYLGVDFAKPLNLDKADVQRELAKTK